MDLTIERVQHSLAVANKMKKIASENPDLYPVNPDDMFILGMLHDVGYKFTNNQEDHAKIGGDILKRQGYQYWKEVYYHGLLQSDYDSTELRLLNYVDMITGPSGEDMTIKQRINDIGDRYGTGSIQEINAIKLAKFVLKQTNQTVDDEFN